MDCRIILVLLSIVAFASLTNAAGGADYTYEGAKGVDNWPTLFPDYCSGSKQSPIDITNAEEKSLGDDDKLDFSVPETLSGTVLIKNTGHTFQMNAPQDDVTVTGGFLPATYKLLQLHFHWGPDNTRGSEHTVDGNAFPLEVHLVFYKSTYDTSVILDRTDGLAVFGVFFQVGNENEGIEELLKEISKVATGGNATVSATSISLQKLLPININEFYRYSGSLTTPTCNEVVTWTVFKDKLTVSSAQLAEFRKMNSSAGGLITMNYRKTYPLNDRKLYLYSVSASSALVSIPVLVSISLVGLLNIF